MIDCNGHGSNYRREHTKYSNESSLVQYENEVKSFCWIIEI